MKTATESHFVFMVETLTGRFPTSLVRAPWNKKKKDLWGGKKQNKNTIIFTMGTVWFYVAFYFSLALLLVALFTHTHSHTQSQLNLKVRLPVVDQADYCINLTCTTVFEIRKRV